VNTNTQQYQVDVQAPCVYLKLLRLLLVH